MHPRRARLGLIEAMGASRAHRATSPGIRGARASASLKPIPLYPARVGRRRHPRRARLGLIEATTSLADFAIARASEARAPRPH